MWTYVGCGGGDGDGTNGDNGNGVEDLPTKITRVTQTTAKINVDAVLYMIEGDDEHSLPGKLNSAKQVPPNGFPGELIANPLVDADFPTQSCESKGTLAFAGQFTRSSIAEHICVASDYFYIMELTLTADDCNGLTGTYDAAILYYASGDGSGPGVMKIQILSTDGLSLDGIDIASMIVEADADPDAEPDITYIASTVTADGSTMDCIVEDGSSEVNDYQGVDFTNAPFCSDNSDCYYPFIPLQCIDGKCNLPCWKDEFCLFDFFCNLRDPRATNWLDLLRIGGGGICEETYHHIEPSDEICDNYIDDDANGLADCDDSIVCRDTPACTESLCDKDGDGETDDDCCVDGINNDKDYATDCEDPDCNFDPQCNEAGCLNSDEMLDIHTCCTDGLDNDGNGYTDCEDVNCGFEYPRCPPFEFCSNGKDDDWDGDKDCYDPDCFEDPVCVCGWLPCCTESGDDYICSLDPTQTSYLGCEPLIGTGSTCEPIEGPHYGCCTLALSETNPTSPYFPCHDERDNDADGYTDCFDSDCFGNPTCDDEFRCSDGIDNDENGETDCEDSNCSSYSPDCNEKKCGSGDHLCCWNDEDDDGDGLTDCNDPDCNNTTHCNERYCKLQYPDSSCCENGFDDEGDGLTDCDDPDCEHTGSCQP
jgi:hypothetical protein